MKTILGPHSILTPEDHLFVRRLSIIIVTLFSIFATFEWLIWSGLPYSLGFVSGATIAAKAVTVLVVTLLCGMGVVAAFVVARPLLSLHRVVYDAVLIATIAIAGIPPAILLAYVDPTPVGAWGLLILWLTSAGSYLLSIGSALLAAALLIRRRLSDQARQAAWVRAAQAVAQVEHEELRLRKEMADLLHGTVQNKLVVASVGLDAIAARLAALEEHAYAEQLRTLALELDELRDHDVRSVSHALYPAGANIGTLDAIRLIVDRVPAAVHTTIDLGADFRDAAEHDRLSARMRLTLIHLIEEGLTNALKHGARAVHLRADAADSTLWITIDDDGKGLAVPKPALHGLHRLQDKIQARGGTLALRPSPILIGTRLEVRIPLRNLLR